MGTHSAGSSPRQSGITTIPTTQPPQTVRDLIDGSAMKRSILNRYEPAEDGRLIIDASVRSVEDLYSHFDRYTAYTRRDLEQDFVDYLIECVKEIRRHGFLIRINLTTPVSADNKERVRRSIHNYFVYLRAVEVGELKRLLRKSLSYLILGVLLVAFTVLLSMQPAARPTGLSASIIREGITIAAWVSMWEAFTNLIFEWSPHKQRISIYRRIVEAEVIFREAGGAQG